MPLPVVPYHTPQTSPRFITNPDAARGLACCLWAIETSYWLKAGISHCVAPGKRGGLFLLLPPPRSASLNRLNLATWEERQGGPP